MVADKIEAQPQEGAVETNLSNEAKFKKILGHFVTQIQYEAYREDAINEVLRDNSEYKDLAQRKTEFLKNIPTRNRTDEQKEQIREFNNGLKKIKNEVISKKTELSTFVPDNTENALPGWSEYLEKLVKDGNLNHGGQGYLQINSSSNNYINKPIEKWYEFNLGLDSTQYISISLQGGMGLFKSTYLHWIDTRTPNINNNININPIWDGRNVVGLEVGKKKDAQYHLVTRHYTLQELCLFDSNEPNDKIKEMFGAFVDFRKREINDNFFVDYCKDVLERKSNIILTGAPGTGKTWLAKEIAARIICRKNYDSVKNDQDFSSRCKLVQFHPSYDYTDFVEGLRPEIPKNRKNNEIAFLRKDGIFKAFCKDAINKNEKFVFIIDEINRGELSKILGELFYSIDQGYRGEEGKVQTQYQTLIKKNDPFYNGFYIPSNVLIIGTMNDIDRSVESMDFAMRRRFSFIEVGYEDRIEMLDCLKRQDVKEKAKKALKAINDAIVNDLKLSTAYHIGPSYFLDLQEGKYNGDFALLWEFNIKGILQEYLRGTKAAAEKVDSIKTKYDNAISPNDSGTDFDLEEFEDLNT